MPGCGCWVSVISSGGLKEKWGFVDGSETGSDVLFLTSAKLSWIDVESALEVYDAHVCTGAEPCITLPNVQSRPCETEASCKAAPFPQPGMFGAPASATFQGPGNPTPTPLAVKGKAKARKAQLLVKALKACKKKSKRKRHACERQARKKYGAKKASAKKASAKKGKQ